MANEPYNININANVKAEELQKLIAELNALNAVIGDLNNMTLSGIQKSAETLITTGMSLTDAIKAQNTAFEELKKSSDKAVDGLQKVGDGVEYVGQKVNRQSQIFEGFFLELGAMGARFATQLPAALFKSIEAFGRQEMAVQKLSAAVRSNGGNVSEVLPIMRQFASEIQRITTYGDEQVLAMQAMASSMGVSSDQMQGVIRSAIGLASALNMDVMTAVKAASAAVQGKTGALQTYIPALSKCKTEEEKLAEVQKLSASGFAQAKAEAETTSGRLKQCVNAWGDLAETAGGVFAPVATDIAGLLKGMCEVLSENSGVAALLTGTLTSLSVAMAFSKIGGLPSVITLLKLTGGALLGVKGASDARRRLGRRSKNSFGRRQGENRQLHGKNRKARRTPKGRRERQGTRRSGGEKPRRGHAAVGGNPQEKRRGDGGGAGRHNRACADARKARRRHAGSRRLGEGLGGRRRSRQRTRGEGKPPCAGAEGNFGARQTGA